MCSNCIEVAKSNTYFIMSVIVSKWALCYFMWLSIGIINTENVLMTWYVKLNYYMCGKYLHMFCFSMRDYVVYDCTILDLSHLWFVYAFSYTNYSSNFQNKLYSFLSFSYQQKFVL